MTACASSAIAVLRGLLKPPQWWEGRDLSFRQEKTGFSRLGRQGHPEINKGSIFALVAEPSGCRSNFRKQGFLGRA